MKFLFYPKKLIGSQKFKLLLDKLGYKYTNDINIDVDFIVLWDYKNETIIPKELKELNKPIINGKCLNIKKDYVDSIFTEIFGYSSFVNPETHKGYCVEKSTQNAIHNGKIVKCPRKRDGVITYSGTGVKHNRIYQRLIDTRIDKDKIHDIRVPIVNGNIPFVFIKELGLKSTFHPYDDEYYKCYTQKTTDVFNLNEVCNILEFSKKIGLDIGELDILRDNSSGLIYIVDVNNIPAASIFNHLNNKDYVVETLANEFKMWCDSFKFK